MALDRKLDDWTAAGLIDAEAAERIRAWEAAHPEAQRPVLRLAVAGLGLFAVGLGLILLVAANWDIIPDPLKLAVHLGLTAAAAWLAWRWRNAGWRSEAALFVLGALVLAGIGLQAQVYQLTGHLWEALLSWAALMTPAFLLLGRGRVTALAWALLTGGALVSLAADTGSGTWPALLAQGLFVAWPPLLVLLSMLPRLASPDFRQALKEVGLVAILAGASLVHIAWAQTITAPEAAEMLVRLLPGLAASAAALLVARRGDGLPRPLVLPLLLGPALAVLAACTMPHPDIWWSRLIGVFIYMGMWGSVAHASAMAGWNRLFGVAIAAVAVRIFIIYIELFGSLATTGGGLVIGGLLLLGLAWGWQRLTARFAR